MNLISAHNYKFISISTEKRFGKICCLIVCFFLFIHSLSFAQTDSILYKNHPDTNVLITSGNKTAIRNVAIANGVIYGGSLTALYYAWYKNYPQSHFRTFNDFDEWKQMDKIGHVYSAYTMSRYSTEIWKSTGMERKKSIWIGGLSGIAYQTIIETLDGFSAEWGWSWADVGGNILGSAAFMAQELAWNEQRIQLKTSFHRKTYGDASLNQRSNALFGKTAAERFLKDYNGQTYWASANLRSFFPHSKIPSWLQVSVGVGAEGMFGGRENIAKDKDGNVIFSRPDIKRYRQWYLAPDIDLTKIKTKNKYLKGLFFVLNSLKFPMPTVELSNGGLKWNWLHF
jgi:hypothetical protein